MKKLIALTISIITIFCLCGCKNDGDCAMGGTKTKVTMTAKILEINDTILVDVTKSEYAFGNYILLVDDTCYFSSNGEKISKGELKVGDEIEIKYSGQVMLSYPPQVVAYIITVK